MKKLRHNIRILATVLVVMFIGLGAYFSYTVYFYGSRWVASANNPRLQAQKKVVTPGDIGDRNGRTLATTVNGERTYPTSGALRRAVAHVVGDSIGIVSNGAETFMAGYLLGFHAGALERIQQLFSDEAERGDDIRLTIDAELCEYAAGQLARYDGGAIVVLNYKTGEILCSTSYPDFDPRDVSAAMTGGEDNGALINRVTQGMYPPGSTFKIITMASALENLPDVMSRGYRCTGTLLVDKSTITEASGQVHGVVTMQQAFAKSCNTTFGSLALELDYARLSKTASAFGFGDNFLFKDTVLYNSQYPITNQSRDDLAWSGVGQGRVLVTPLHMALIAGAVANDGMMMEPRLLLSAEGATGTQRSVGSARTYKRVCSQEVAQVLKEFMVSAVQSGTGTQAQISGYTVGGKTGSAETSDDKSVNTHAWYVGYVDSDRHPYAVAVVVERGGSGGSVAAPIAQRVLQRAIQAGY